MVRVAVTADLHWGSRHPEGIAATRLLATDLYHDPPDLLVLAGDIGAGDDFAACLEVFAGLPCVKALVPGNHDVWVRPDDARGNSLDVYKRHLPEAAHWFGFHYLDNGPLIWETGELAVVGSMNWYDYSWAIDRLPAAAADWKERLRAKRIGRGKHNDANFVRWPHDDISFTGEAVAALANHLRRAAARVPAVLLVTHHPAFRGLGYPKQEPLGIDELLWEAFTGNAAVERLLGEYGARVPLAICGHTHFAREAWFGPTRGFNVGGDYHFKRLLRFDWNGGSDVAVEATEYAAE